MPPEDPLKGDAGTTWRPDRAAFHPEVRWVESEVASMSGEEPHDLPPGAPWIRVPPEAEEAFYRLNRLPARLAQLYAPVASRDPDPDDVEEIGPEARALLASHVLLDDFVDRYYEALVHLTAAQVRVGRPGGPDRTVTSGRPALLALRAVWCDAWQDQEVLARLQATGSVALAARPVWVRAAADASVTSGR